MKFVKTIYRKFFIKTIIILKIKRIKSLDLILFHLCKSLLFYNTKEETQVEFSLSSLIISAISVKLTV